MKSVLRVSPEFFEVAYAINPHMKIGSVDRAQAFKQWHDLGRVYDSIALRQHVLPGQEELPDMVFAANQAFPFMRDGEASILLSQMASPMRQPEVKFFKLWFENRGVRVYELPHTQMLFEAMGDTLYDPSGEFLWGGFGFRTQPLVHEYIHELTGLELRPLRLVDPAFYHLDVSFCPLTEQSALYYPNAFDEASRYLLEQRFSDLIPVTREEAFSFVCNAHCPDGRHVILERGSERVEALLRRRGFVVIPVNTSEFIKAGGSVFCMKLDLPFSLC